MTRKTFLVWILVSCLSLTFGQTSTAPSSTPLPLKPWVLHSRIVHEVLPAYPAVAGEKPAQEDVFLSVVVDENGQVKMTDVIRSSNTGTECSTCFSSAEQASMEAVRKWAYQPFMAQGKPLVVSSWVAFRFHSGPKPSVEILTRSEESTPNVVIGGIIRQPQASVPTGSPTSADSKKVMVPLELMENHLIHHVEPVYPPMAKIAHIQGDVVLKCIIDEQGNVVDVKAVSGHPILIQSAIDAVKKWKYSPFLMNGSEVSVESTVTVSFHL